MTNGFLLKFKVPNAALPAIEQMVTRDEILLLEALDSGSFRFQDAKDVMEKATGETWPDSRISSFLRSAYKRGVILLEDESFTRFRTGTFYGRLDIFCVTETEKYLALPREVRTALDAWYFQAYLDGLGDAPTPSEDRVVTMQQAFDHIDAADRQIWLNRCDCRTLAGNCGRPTDTCITFRNGINTMSHRGWLKPVTKEEAKDVVRRANAAGLMQTVNPNGLCNCCGDCCYLFRAQKARNRGLAWPAAALIAQFAESECIRCGRCTKRCHFGAFAWDSGKIRYDPAQCRGCGLCAQTCPVGVITMVNRTGSAQ